MAKQLTLNQTIKLIREIALSHDQINTVYFGDVWEFLAQTDNVYPAMFYSLTGSNISGKNLAMDFSLFFLDRQLQDETNETDVLSDQLLIAQDIFAMFNYPKFDWEIDTNVSIEFFTENEKDYLAGVKFDITLNYPMLNDRCQVPSAFSYPEYVASISQNGGAVNYVKFLIDYPSFATLPANGDSSKIYVTNDNNKLYRWVDNAFIEISPTSSTTWGNIGGTLSSQTDLQTALNAKAPLASPTFTGTVSGITKSMVGLGNVDNTTDLLKPISTATQTALNLKYDASNPSNYLTVITSGQITTALGFTPYDASNPSNFISSITSGNITTALGFTPSNDSLVVHLAGTETITGRKTFNPSVTAASAIARGTYLTPTLIASANSDVLVGLDINPTFTNGAFTGVTNYALRVQGKQLITFADSNYLAGLVINNTSTSTASSASFGLIVNGVTGGGIGYLPSNWVTAIQRSTLLISSNGANKIGFSANIDAVGGQAQDIWFSTMGANSTYQMQIKGNGNVQINSNTDAGFRLDVVGTSRITTSLNIGGTTTDASAILQADSTTKGFLPPRMTTTQKNAISSPATGLVVYDTTLNKLCVRTASAWETLTSL